MKNRKGQAAMEFLMTYGWAILAAIVVIAVLAIYFRPSTLVSGSTFVTAPFYAVGSTISLTTVQVEVKNNGGETLNVTGFAIPSVKSPSGAACTGNSVSSNLLAGASVIVSATCTGLTAGDTFSGDLGITYLKSGSTLAQKSTGTVAGKVSA